MVKKVLLVLLTIVAIASLSACGENTSGDDKSTGDSAKYSSYEQIYNDYAQKIKDATPGLIDEFKSESEGITDLNELAKISTKKVEELAKINTKGTEEMAKLMLQKGEDETAYKDWATKLYDIYEECSLQITDVYMDSGMAAF